MPSPLRSIDWGSIAPLRLRARVVAEGVYAGAHRSLRRGPGVEFGGHRPYVPGDDLRWLDRSALLRHDKLIVREFETETDRGLRIIVDASASMGFRSAKAPAAKYAFAALVAGALARVALSSGDPVGLEWLGGGQARPLPAMAGREAFERIIGALESAEASGDLRIDKAAIEQTFGSIARKARRGTVIVLLSDLLDLPVETLDRFAALASGGRVLFALQILDPEEARFPFEGTVRLRAVEGKAVIETDADTMRARYLAALAAVSEEWSRKLTSHGGQFLRCETTDEPADLVRMAVSAIAGRFVAKRDAG
ncbi:MAG TPA: DUF58 domain-containing protein [Polyangiaceae bacterium]|nr:DUF58 domain-containing protein [Polyangiaceae bacterium]